jgi:hypothetical protein
MDFQKINYPIYWDEISLSSPYSLLLCSPAYPMRGDFFSWKSLMGKIKIPTKN